MQTFLKKRSIEVFASHFVYCQLLYYCGVEGCVRFDQDSTQIKDDEDVLVVSRNTKTVRAVDMRTGAEK